MYASFRRQQRIVKDGPIMVDDCTHMTLPCVTESSGTRIVSKFSIEESASLEGRSSLLFYFTKGATASPFDAVGAGHFTYVAAVCCSASNSAEDTVAVRVVAVLGCRRLSTLLIFIWDIPEKSSYVYSILPTLFCLYSGKRVLKSSSRKMPRRLLALLHATARRCCLYT